jgi:hypothetical protein
MADAPPAPNPPVDHSGPEPTDAEIAAPILARFQKLMADQEPVTKPIEDDKGGKDGKDGKSAPDAKPAEGADGKPPELKKDDKPNPLEDVANMSPKTREKWEHIKSSREEWKTKATAAETQLETLRRENEALKATTQKIGDPAEIENIRKENKELGDRLRLLDIERHPKFQSYWDGQINTALESARSVVGKDHASKLDAILAMPDGTTKDEQLEALAENLSGVKQGQLGAALATLTRVKAERAAEVQKTHAQWDKIQADERGKVEQQSAQAKAAREANVVEALKLAAKLPAFTKIEGDTAHNDSITQAEAFVRHFINGKLPHGVMLAMPAVFQDYLFKAEKTIPGLKAEIERLKGIIGANSNANPNARGGGGKPNPAPPPTGPDGSSFVNAFRRAREAQQ